MDQISFQDQGAIEHCYGCGANNSHGLQLKSYWRDDTAVAEFTPQSFHCAGSTEIVYGGLIAGLIDCHSCNLAAAYLYKSEGRRIGSNPRIGCVTAQINVSLLKPCAISRPVEFEAQVRSIERSKIWVDCLVRSGEDEVAKGEVLVIRLKDAM
ncbi:MAG: PaaI family thioesterase [Pseudomonadota bacterium]